MSLPRLFTLSLLFVVAAPAFAAAQVLSDRAGARLGPVLSIEESTDSEPIDDAGTAAPSPAADAPAPPVQAGESRLEASVSVVFELVD